MSFDIQPVLFDFLSRRKTVLLPGVGSLVWKVQRAQKGQALSELDPPSIHLDIEKESGSSEIFVNYLSHQLQLSKKEAQTIFGNWIDQIKENLTKGQTVEIDNVGKLSRDENSHIKFEQDPTLVASYFHLPNVRLTPISRKYQPEGVILAKYTEDSLLNKVMTNVVVPVLLLLAIGVLSYFLLKQPLFTGDQPISQDIDTIEASVSTPDPEQEADEAISTNMEDSEDVMFSDSMTQNNVLDTSINTSSSDELKEETLYEEDAEERLNDFKDRFCIIILGSFKKQSNVQDMVRKISELGLETYTESYNDYTRVGVRFDCYQKDLYRTLFQLRGDFGDDAWILKYKE